MAKDKFIRPSPVFEGHFSDGTTLRMSFPSPVGKPIKAEIGAALVTNVATAQIENRRKLVEYAVAIGELVTLVNYRHRDKVGGTYSEQSRRLERIEHRKHFITIAEPVYGEWQRIDGRWRQPAMRNDRKLVAGYVEHPSLGRVEYQPQTLAAKAPKRANATLLAIRAILAKHQGDNAAAIAALRQIAA